MAQFREDNIPHFSLERIQNSRRGYEIYVRRKHDSKSKNILPILKTKMALSSLKISYGQNRSIILECMRAMRVRNHTG